MEEERKTVKISEFVEISQQDVKASLPKRYTWGKIIQMGLEAAVGEYEAEK